MSFRQHPLPPEASEAGRTLILDALRANDYFIYRDSADFLRRNAFRPEGVVEDLIAYIESGKRVYVLSGPSIKGIKYQCCLDYEDIIIHAKIAKGAKDPCWFLKLSFHEHNTGAPPLPA